MKTFNVKLLYAYKFISQCLPMYAFYTLLFIKRGLSVSEVAALIVLWSVFTIVFEVPSGILADRWNRRNMLVLASVLQGLCFVVWFFSHAFWMFALGFVFWAIAGAFTSGTEEGLLFDNLKHDGCEDRFTAIYGKAQFFANIGTASGLASAGVLANFIQIETLALLSAAICFFNAGFALQLREKNFYAEQLTPKIAGFVNTLKEAATFIRGSGVALLSVLFMVLFASIGSYLDEFDALIINDFQINPVWVSVLLTVRFVLIALGDVLAPMVQKKISSLRQIFAINAAACALLAAFAVIWHPYAIPLFGLACMAMTIAEVLLVNALQNEVKEAGRATVMSFCSVGQNIVMICFSAAYALLAGIYTLQYVYIIISALSIAGSFAFYVLPGGKGIKRSM